MTYTITLAIKTGLIGMTSFASRPIKTMAITAKTEIQRPTFLRSTTAWFQLDPKPTSRS